MAYTSIWYYTDLPSEVVNILSNDLLSFDTSLESSKLYNGFVDRKIRNSKNAWIPTTHWISGFLWFYLNKANNENFLYNLTGIDGETLQYTQYGIGEKYNWHVDDGIKSFYITKSRSNREIDNNIDDFVNQQAEKVRKLSFVLQLSEYDEYEGGNFQIMDDDGKLIVAPRKKGSMIVFDSRCKHRVTKVTNGVRKSIVGWAVGPRWR